MAYAERDSNIDNAAMRQKLLSHLVDQREILLCDAMRILGSRDRAEDVVQDAAIRCLQSRAITGAVGSPRGLVRRMVQNLALDQRRREQRENATPFEPGEEPPCNRPNAEGRLAEREILLQVVEEIDTLPIRDRQIFLKHRLESQPQKDIARHLGLSPARINGIVGKIHSRLRQMVDNPRHPQPARP